MGLATSRVSRNRCIARRDAYVLEDFSNKRHHKGGGEEETNDLLS